jgi:hypothetical protein
VTREAVRDGAGGRCPERMLRKLAARPRKLVLGAALALAAGCSGSKPPLQATGPVASRSSDAKGREKVSITVYNSNFGLVRERRAVSLAKGRVELAFADVSAHIQPETVHIRSLGDPDALTVLEQNYRYDLLTPQKLLEKYVGKRVKIVRHNEKLGTDEILPAEVLAVEGGPVLRIDGEIVTNFPGRFVFPDVPENLVAKPTLVWLLASGAERQRVEVSYLTGNLSWRADYVLVLDAKDQAGDLTGWVTLENTSGASYPNAELKLVAGDVQKLAPDRWEGEAELEDRDGSPEPPPPPRFQQESLFEYHLYSLTRPTDLLDKEKKQVTLLEAHGVALRKKLVFRGLDAWFRSRFGELPQNQKVSVFVELENSKARGLGMPLPKGIVRVYKADTSGAQQFVGEDSIDHTPRDEKIEVKLGEAFDVVADRKQMEWRALGACTSESSWSIALRNHKDEGVTIEVIEPANGDWEILSSSHKFEKEDAQTFKFTIDVPGRGETKVSYKIRVRWC